MKIVIPIAAFIFSLAGFVSVSAQQSAPPPPPAPANEYSPKVWKEYVFADDNVRFRFPIEPIKAETVSGMAKYPAHAFTNRKGMFIMLQLSVVTFPNDANLETGEVLKGAEQSGLDRIKDLAPKIIKDEEITVDGHGGKFLLIETNDGQVLRLKFFTVKNRLYNAVAIVEKGKRHGFNWENDFEVPAMAFLDSIHVN